MTKNNTTKEIAVVQKCLLMKTGSEIWVSQETADKLDAQLINQTKHVFIKIKEINRTINTAEVAEIMTVEQMDERNRLKRKEWQCTEKKWHEPRQKCYCKEERIKAEKAEREREELAEQSRPRTPEEQARIKKYFKDTRKILEEKGILTKKMSVGHIVSDNIK